MKVSYKLLLPLRPKRQTSLFYCMIYILSGAVLLCWGIWCIIAAFQKRKAQGVIFYNDAFLPKTILGKYYDLVINLSTGIICLAFGLFLLCH
jgi:uncharacterized membrane protein HdeD (DUF308 family)